MIGEPRWGLQMCVCWI